MTTAGQFQMPRSILKQSRAAEQKVPSQDDRNRATAVHHANLLQQRKDVEALILSSMEALLDLPSSPDADPAKPSSSDAALFKNSLKPFQPSDYDELITERNINRQCGYVLCPRENKVENPGKKYYRILRGKGKGPDALRFVEKSYLEKWCSDECGRRALYIKVQLDEEPAWARGRQASGDLVLLDEKPYRQENADALTEGMQGLNMEEKEEDIIQKMKALAIERGDHKSPSRSFGLAEVDIQEKETGRAHPPHPIYNQGHASNTAGIVEGYQPQHIDHRKLALQPAEHDSTEDIAETI